MTERQITLAGYKPQQSAFSTSGTPGGPAHSPPPPSNFGSAWQVVHFTRRILLSPSTRTLSFRLRIPGVVFALVVALDCNSHLLVEVFRRQPHRSPPFLSLNTLA